MADNLPYQPFEYGRHTKLHKSETITILRSAEIPRIKAIPYKPKGGEIYLIESDKAITSNDWRATGHRMYQVRISKINVIRVIIITVIIITIINVVIIIFVITE